MFNFNFLKSLISSQTCLGVDIGTTSIKMVEIAKGSNRPKLRNYGLLESYGHLERINNAIQTSTLKIMERDTAEILKLLLNQLKVKSQEVIASMPAFSSFFTLLELPEMSEEDMAKTMSFQISQYIPLPASEVTIDWFKVGQREDEKGFTKQQIFLISTPNEQIRKYKNVFKLAGLRLRALEIESVSLARSLAANDPTTTLLVDIGARSTNIVVVDKGFLKHSSQTDFAGSSLTQAIANGLNINVRRAEELKKQRGILGTGSEYELSTLTFPFLDAIISEVKRARDAYEKNQEGKIERIILVGGGANLLGINKYFEEQMGLATIIGNPFLRIDYPGKIEPMVKELGPTLAVAIGLAIRNFI